MVQMSNTEVTLNSSVRQPSVSYQAAVRMPDAPITSKVNEPKTDWVNYVLSEGGRALQGYASGQAGASRQDTKSIEDAKKEADLINRNQLAREVLKISEAQRQGMSQTEAETKLRALRDNFIGVLDEKDVDSVIGRHDYGIEELEQSRWKQWQTKEIDRQAKLATDFRAQNAWAVNASDAQVLSWVQRMNDSVDDLSRIQARKNLYSPDTAEYKRYQALEDEACANNMFMNVARHMGNLLLDDKNLNPVSIQQIKNEGVEWAVSHGINRAQAQTIINNVCDRMGVDTLKEQWIDTLKISKESAEAASQAIMANAKLTVMSIPGVALYQQLGGEAFNESVNQKISLSNSFDVTIKNITDALMKAASKPTVDLSEDLTGVLIQGTNNSYADGKATPYSRGTVALGTLKLINQNNGVSFQDGEGTARIALANIDGASERLNLTAIRRDAKKLQESDDVESNEVGRQLEKEADKLDANKIAAEIMTPASPLYQPVKGLQDSLNASELRYDEDGKAFLSDTSGILGDIALAFRGVGGEGSYLTQLNRLNEGLKDLTPEVRKEVLDRLGFSKAVRGEVSVLGSRQGHIRTIDTGEKGAELYTFSNEELNKFSDGTVVRNETGVEGLPESMPRSLQQVISDWWKNQETSSNRSKETTKKSADVKTQLSEREQAVSTGVKNIYNNFIQYLDDKGINKEGAEDAFISLVGTAYDLMGRGVDKVEDVKDYIRDVDISSQADKLLEDTRGYVGNTGLVKKAKEAPEDIKNMAESAKVMLSDFINYMKNRADFNSYREPEVASESNDVVNQLSNIVRSLEPEYQLYPESSESNYNPEEAKASVMGQLANIVKSFEEEFQPKTTRTRLTSSSSQTFNNSYPAIDIESDEGNPNIMYDPVNNRMIDPRDLRQDFGDTSIRRGETPARLKDFHKDLLISQETLDKKPDLKVYDDGFGNDTIGYGHKLTKAEKASGKFKKGISEEQAWNMFVKDYAQAERDVDSLLKEKGIDYIPEAARLVLVNMTYNMGKGYVDKDGKIKGLKSFTNMFKAIKEGNVDNIVKEMKNSSWYRQVTSRAETLMQLMREAYE